MTTIRKAATSILVILAVAFLVRTTFAWSQIAKVPQGANWAVPFETETGHIAYSVATGKGFSSPFQRDSGPTAWLTPVYPFLLAAIFKISGVYTRASFLIIIFWNIVCSTATCLPIFRAGKRIAGLGAASGAAWLWALFPNAILIPFEWIWDTSLAALLAATLLWATLELADSKRWRDWIGYGLLWGLALMTNPAVGAVLPMLLAWLGYRQYRAGRVRLVRPALAALVTLACCVPWTIRNFVVFHRFIPFRSNFSYELYIGNNENYDERRLGLPTIITQDMETLRYLRMGETAFMDEEKRKALQFMKTHPHVVVRLFEWRFVDFWMGVADPWRTFQKTDSWLVRGILLGNLVSALGALSGILVLLWKRDVYAIPVAAFPLFFPILYYVTHTSLRYRHPIDPVVLLLTTIAMGAIGRGMRNFFWPDMQVRE